MERKSKLCTLNLPTDVFSAPLHDQSAAACTRARLAKGYAYLQGETAARGPRRPAKALEQKIVWRELLDLELQEIDEQFERISEQFPRVYDRVRP